MCLARLVSFRVVTSPSLCHFQKVRVHLSVCLFPCPDIFLPLLSPGSERTSPTQISFCFLTSSSRCHLQDVSAPHNLPCRDKSLTLPPPVGECASLGLFISCGDTPSLPLLSPGSECTLLGQFLSMSRQVFPSTIFRK